MRTEVAIPRKGQKQYYSKEKRSEYNRNYRHDGKRAPDFVGVDGEGATRNGVHEYIMLRAGEDFLIHKDLSPLGAEECLRWLLDLPNGKKYVAFSFGYDITMMLKEILTHPNVKAREHFLSRYMNRELWTEWEWQHGIQTPYRAIQVDWMPSKHLKVSGRNSAGKLTSTLISDVFGLFQSKFTDAIKAWKVTSPEEIAHIEDMKDKRSEFDGSQEEIEYNHRECILLADMMESVRNACRDSGIPPNINYEGAGKIAEALLGVKHTATQDNRKGSKAGDIHIPADVQSAANAAYYGGRFEINTCGEIKRPVWEFDINSAYPASMDEGLPCLIHGHWLHRDHLTEADIDYLELTTVARVQWEYNDPRGISYGPFPVRKKAGGIVFPISSFHPRDGQKPDWYWLPEISAALRSGKYTLTFSESWSWIATGCDCTTFDWVRPLYEERIRIGKAGKGYVIKLGLNSLYGKTAQRKGVAAFFNPVWAGMITSRTRAKLYDAIQSASSEDNIVMIATDAVYSLEDLPLACDPKALGAWDKEEYPGMFIVQPGVYWKYAKDADDDLHFKSRGISAKTIIAHRREIEKCWHYGFSKVNIVLPNVFHGMRIAQLRNKPEIAGQWYPEERKLSFTMQGKRDVRWDQWLDDSRRAVRSFPYDSCRNPSKIYDIELEYGRDELLRGENYDADGNYGVIGAQATALDEMIGNG